MATGTSISRSNGRRWNYLTDHVQGVALTLTQLSVEFGVSESHVRFTTCALFLGLCIGASFWGIMSDVVGRRLAFNMTLFLCGVFGIAVGGSPTWIGYVASAKPECPQGPPLTSCNQSLRHVRLYGTGCRW